MGRITLCSLLTCLLGACGASQAQPPDWLLVVNPLQPLGFNVLHQGQPWCSWEPVGWGPNWGWTDVSAQSDAATQGRTTTGRMVVDADAGQVIDIRQQVSQPAPNTVKFTYRLTAARDVPLTALVTAWQVAEANKAGEAELTTADGNATTWPLNFAGIATLDDVRGIELRAPDAATVTVGLTPARPIRRDGGLRLVLAENTLPAGEQSLEVLLTFPTTVGIALSEADLQQYTTLVPSADWYPFAGQGSLADSPLSFASWLDKPAGARGGVRQQGDSFVLGDGTPIKFWGTNLSYQLSAPEKQDAAFLAQRFARWGVNAVRMHKFTNPMGWEGIGNPDDMTQMDPVGLDRLDNFSNELAQAGVYYGWSHSFGVTVRPGNRDRLLAPDEVLGRDNGKTYALINFAPDIQDLMIEMVVNLLRHRNPYTGRTYAEDPALAFVELQNEDDIFFWTTESALNNYPTYAKALRTRWAQWLAAKYGTTAQLRAAWSDALAADESIEADNLALQGNMWNYSANLPNLQGGTRQRILDNAAFFHDEQNSFYSRFVQAIRDAGYQGPLCGSPWQAPAMVPHYYNLRSDAMVGFIDRHNYFGAMPSDTMLGAPGSGYLSSGLQQVADRPFALSEWITVYPALYAAEGPPLVAAYGLGLQGWDASYEFQSQGGRQAWFPHAGNPPYGVWNVDTPTQLGQYPILARMLARGDVQEAEVLTTRRVALENLRTGEFDFTDIAEQAGDVKRFGGTVPAATLARGRVLVEFAEQPTASTFPPAAAAATESIDSTTGQLRWDPEQRVVTINTAGTKGVVGFGGGQEYDLGGLRLRLQTPYASVLVGASERDSDLSDCATALISAVARIANTGFTIFSVDERTLNNGTPPMLIEPVVAELRFDRPVRAVRVLDHDGLPTAREADISDGVVRLDGAKDQSPYYVVEFGN